MREVSILTRPEGRVQHIYRSIPEEDFGVSILTRPEGRVQPGDASNAVVSSRTVSILTRPEGRVQLSVPNTINSIAC